MRVNGRFPALEPLIVPPKAIDPPVKALASIVKSDPSLSVVGTVPLTVNPLAWMLVTAALTVSPLAPELIVRAPSGIDEPTLPDNVAAPVVVSVKAWLPETVPSMVLPNEIGPDPRRSSKSRLK